MEMESNSSISREDEQMELPPGFRFHPTDEELITHYLAEKVLDNNFNTIAIGEADLNKVEPWDLPKQAKMGEKEWYFFVVRDRKYPTGLRTNRATQAGYWKATGKDKEIYKTKSLVGMKKTLVFYTGRAPKGEKTNWVMHEYRLEGKYSKYNLPKNAKNDWVISRIFHKGSNTKKSEIPEMVTIQNLSPSFLPPLMDSSPYKNSDPNSITSTNPSHVTCFSDLSMLDNHQFQSTKQEDKAMFDTFTSTNLISPISNVLLDQDLPDFRFDDSLFSQDRSMLKLLLEGNGSTSNNSEVQAIDNSISEFSNQNILSHLNIPIENESFWDY